MYSKLNKYNLFQTKFHYSGHVVSKEGIIVDMEKIKSVMEWPTLKNVDAGRSFIGLVGYYNRLIKNFTWIGYHITSLQGKGKKLEWIEECVASFELLKHFLKML